VVYYPPWTNAIYDTEDCLVAQKQMNEPELDLLNATKILFLSFNETCHDDNTCSASAESIGSVVKRNYTSLMGKSIEPMESVCESMGEDYKLCFITTEVSNGNLRTQEINKPVCFPPSCSDDNATLVEEICDPSSSCEIISSTAHCPSRNERFSYENCIDDSTILNANRRLRRFRLGLQQSMTRECVNVLVGSKSPVCDVSSLLQVSVTKDFKEFEEDQNYINFANACKNHGGVDCKLSIYSTGRLSSSESIFDFDSEIMYTEYPFCKPLECSTGDPNIYAKQILFDSGFDCFESECDIDVDFFSCGRLELD